jgi:hypothetical protein
MLLRIEDSYRDYPFSVTRPLACGTTIELCVATFPDYQQVTVVTVHVIPADVLSHRAHAPFIPRQRLDNTVVFARRPIT